MQDPRIPQLLRIPLDLIANRAVPQQLPESQVPANYPGDGRAVVELRVDQLSLLLRSINRTQSVQTRPLIVTTTPSRILDRQENRSYLFIQNQDGAASMILGFGQAPTISGTVANGLIVPPSLGFYEPLVSPIDEVWAVSSVGTINGFVIFTA